MPVVRLEADYILMQFFEPLSEMAHLTRQAQGAVALSVLAGTLLEIGNVLAIFGQSRAKDSVEAPAYRFQAEHADTTIVNFTPSL